MVLLTVDVIVRPDQSLGRVNHVLLIVAIWFAMPSDLPLPCLYSFYATLKTATRIALFCCQARIGLRMLRSPQDSGK